MIITLICLELRAENRDLIRRLNRFEGLGNGRSDNDNTKQIEKLEKVYTYYITHIKTIVHYPNKLLLGS